MEMVKVAEVGHEWWLTVDTSAGDAHIVAAISKRLAEWGPLEYKEDWKKGDPFPVLGPGVSIHVPGRQDPIPLNGDIEIGSQWIDG